jgi:hypothetical protein
MAVIIDPPSGWKYGFPKPIPEEVTDLGEWLVEEGYPEELVEVAKKHSRYWTADV